MKDAAALDGAIIVVGAGRSGTTMLRNALGLHEDVRALPYEVNYLWRHGNRDWPDDFLVPEQHLRPRVRSGIRRRLVALAGRVAARGRVLDKTVANVGRLRFVNAVLPEARVIHIVRDGRAVAASALQRWDAPQPTGYYLSKVRTIPFADVPAYAWRYLRGRLKGRAGQGGVRASWGLRFPGIDEMVRTHSLARVCGAQWRWAVSSALEQGETLGAGRVLVVRYEEVVADPVPAFRRLQDFLGLAPSAAVEAWVRRTVVPDKREGWRGTLDDAALADILEEEGPLLARLGYT